MAKLDLQQHPHRRFNPLTREWILVSPHRTQRPWQGQVEAASLAAELQYDPQCYMCPGNLRASGHRTAKYENVFVFDNDYPALLADTPQSEFRQGELIVAQGEPGICRVMCFSPRHDLTLSRMGKREIELVVDAWTDEYKRLSALPSINYVQIFENRGPMMGCSNPHPHCQIWATATLPTYPKVEQQSFQEYTQAHRSCLLCDYLKTETGLRERIVCENSGFVALVPFWAMWPFETLILSKRHAADMAEFNADERSALADILKRLTVRYDNLFQTSFPYSMGFHQRPGDSDHPEWHFHAHFYPPLLRSATIRKFIVGYELLAAAQRDITPESAAERLRQLSETHFSSLAK
jgi:UDPglucose--hexose-1-phosphate uridylyltransferase